MSGQGRKAGGGGGEIAHVDERAQLLRGQAGRVAERGAGAGEDGVGAFGGGGADERGGPGGPERGVAGLGGERGLVAARELFAVAQLEAQRGEAGVDLRHAGEGDGGLLEQRERGGAVALGKEGHTPS